MHVAGNALSEFGCVGGLPAGLKMLRKSTMPIMACRRDNTAAAALGIGPCCLSSYSRLASAGCASGGGSVSLLSIP
jgi:hypothetical protein